MPRIIVTEEQWIRKGIERFEQGGIDQLVVEKMAVSLGCSKSSFYWYFNNRSSYIRQIVETWKEQTTQQVIAASIIHAAADERIKELLTQMFGKTKRGDFLFYLRKLSLKDDSYRSLLDEVEQMRMEFMKELLIQKGMQPEKAFQRSWMLYHYYLGWYERHKQETLSDEAIQQHIHMIWTEWISNEPN
ncbi:TetR/AcrR family transcriptional regulator [Paenibacillus sp. FSL M8-0228]|uniref:TetR/AcrR family transcriptional regulator n=1 Tax=Paenibacillus TaxID=44249 RepID=UPI00083D6015|nr:TetR/AcrR family transcriptional regulator [Paenibacillus polymyxa]MBO3283036.1 TetR/AcrR family transcriptional regulator [Paenibacillus polymyxa]ODB56900.1 transcriptional regulator [Paenibacillus polymyxa]